MNSLLQNIPLGGSESIDFVLDLVNSDDPKIMQGFNEKPLIELEIDEYEQLSDKEKIIIEVMSSRLTDHQITKKQLREAKFNIREPGFPSHLIFPASCSYGERFALLDSESSLMCELCCNIAVMGYSCDQRDCMKSYCRNCMRILVNLNANAKHLVDLKENMVGRRFDCLACGENSITSPIYDKRLSFRDQWLIRCHRIDCNFMGKISEIRDHLNECRKDKKYCVMLRLVPYISKLKYAIEFIDHEAKKLAIENAKKRSEIK